jgi:DNA-binding NtrC family response regulator
MLTFFVKARKLSLMKNMRQAFLSQRASAERRGIPFRLTYSEWSALWEPYAHLPGMAMCRTNDQGAYELGNVRIDTQDNNARERSLIVFEKAMTAKSECKMTLPERLKRFERRALLLALKRADGSQTNAAHRLGVSFRTFRYLKKLHNI